VDLATSHPESLARAASPASDSRLASRLTLVLYLLAFAIVGQLVWESLVRFNATKGTDFLVIREAGGDLLRGQSPYDPRKIERDLFGPAFHLPPFAAVLAAPFALLGEDEALTAWRLLSLAAHFGALAILLHLFRVPWRTPLAAAALAVLASARPPRAVFIHGQWDCLFLLALSLGLLGLQRGSPWLAALPLAIAGSVKPYPALALGAYLVRRWWPALFAAALGFGLCLALGLALAPAATQTFFSRVTPHLGATTAYAENQSLAGFLARLIEPEMRPLVAESPLVYLGSRLLALVGLGLPLLALGLRRATDFRAEALQYAAWICAAPSVTAAAWMHYQTLLLLPLLVLAAVWWRERHTPGASLPGALTQALYLLALVLIAYGDHYTVLGADAGELWKTQDARVEAANQRLLAQFAGPAVLLLSYKLYGALLLFGLCLVAAWRRSRPEPWPGSWSARLLGRQHQDRAGVA
jgi:hypothetical protein